MSDCHDPMDCGDNSNIYFPKFILPLKKTSTMELESESAARKTWHFLFSKTVSQMFMPLNTSNATVLIKLFDN